MILRGRPSRPNGNPRLAWTAAAVRFRMAAVRARAFRKAVTVDESDLLGLVGERGVSFCRRLKDLADIARWLEAFPALRDRVPYGILDRLY
jgi:hypothetical protein